MKKRILSLALALCLALSLLPGTALAAGEHPFTDVPDTHWAATRWPTSTSTTSWTAPERPPSPPAAR